MSWRLRLGLSFVTLLLGSLGAPPTLVSAQSEGIAAADTPWAVDLGAPLARLPKRPGFLRGDGTDDSPYELAVAAGERADLTLWVPARAELHFTLAGGAGELAMRLETDSEGDAPVRTEALVVEAVKANAEARYRARLPGAEPQPGLLVIENRGESELRIKSLRLLAHGPYPPEILPETVRPPKLPINVILYVIDTARRDRLSVYGYALKTTPYLESLGARGVVFDNAYAPGPATVHTIPALFGSRQPAELRGRVSSRTLVPFTLAEVFQRAGYDTAAFQANYTVRREFGMDRGFDRYESPVDRDQGDRRPVRAGRLHQSAIRWLKRREKDVPFFLYIQTMDVHEYEPPRQVLGRFSGTAAESPFLEHVDFSAVADRKAFLDALERYDETLLYADRELRNLAKALGRIRHEFPTLVVVTSDHGESLGQRGRFLHGQNLYDELVRIPLILSAPWIREALNCDEVVSLIDLAPTLADLAGLEPSPAWTGRSLLLPTLAPQPSHALGALAKYGFIMSAYLRQASLKLHVDAGEGDRLYDVAADPFEKVNLDRRRPVALRYMQDELQRRISGIQPAKGPRRAESLSPEQQREFEQQLKSLGYVE